MAKSDTWPGGVAMEALSNMDSAGSSDSVISMNSGFSEDSMEHLSAEERACLTYLEETIEALEVQEDSGLSNDEPESGRLNGSGLRDNTREHREDQAPTPTLSPASAADGSGDNTSPNLKPQDEPAGEASAACEDGPSPHPAKMLYLSKDEDGHLRILSTGRQQTSEMDLSLIPPPSDFMDEPGPPPVPDKAKDPPPPAGISNTKPVDLELLKQRASMRGTQESKQPPEQSSLSVSASPLPSPCPEASEPKTPPAVAPKPKKLPANIILKAHKAAPAPENLSGHSAPASADRLLMDPQKVRMEALRKLGLLKSDEVDAGPALSPKYSPQSRRSWAAPPSPVSPAPHTPPTTPSHVPSPSHAALQPPGAVSPLVLSKSPTGRSLNIVPAPAAFRDAGGARGEASPVKDVCSPPHDSSGYPEPSGPDEDPGEESGKRLSAAGGATSTAGHAATHEADTRRPPPAHQPSGDSQKLPRSQGVSVLISPRSENEDERRGALKRLGLLRD